MTLFSRRGASFTALVWFGFLATTPAYAAGAANAAPFTIRDAWVRVPPAGGRTGAAYMQIENTGDLEDRLASGTSPAAATVQVHEMTMTNGMMAMHEVAGGLAIPAHGSVTLAPGGYHIMLIGLTKLIKAGDDVSIVLHFAKAGDVTIHAIAKEPQASGMGGMGGMQGMSNMGHPK